MKISSICCWFSMTSSGAFSALFLGGSTSLTLPLLPLLFLLLLSDWLLSSVWSPQYHRPPGPSAVSGTDELTSANVGLASNCMGVTDLPPWLETPNWTISWTPWVWASPATSGSDASPLFGVLDLTRWVATAAVSQYNPETQRRKLLWCRLGPRDQGKSRSQAAEWSVLPHFPGLLQSVWYGSVHRFPFSRAKCLYRVTCYVFLQVSWSKAITIMHHQVTFLILPSHCPFSLLLWSMPCKYIIKTYSLGASFQGNWAKVIIKNTIKGLLRI